MTPTRDEAFSLFNLSKSVEDSRSQSRGALCPSCAASETLENSRGRRECRVKASPMARLQTKKQAAVTTGSAGSSGIPCATVLTVSFALPGDRAFLPPSSARSSRRLDTSVGVSGPHDFAVRDHIIRPRKDCALTSSRPSHPASNVRDDREAPLLSERETGRMMPVIWGWSQSQFPKIGISPLRQISPSGNLRMGCMQELPARCGSRCQSGAALSGR
jgi:hypothetical protein